jgi:hypothetical protein
MALFTDNTSWQAALKFLYTDQVVLSLLYKNRPFLAMIRKDEQGGGQGKPIPIISGAGGSPANVFATAQANQGPAQIGSVLIQYGAKYNVATVKGFTVESSRGAGARAFLDATKTEVDMKLAALMNTIATDAWRTGSGSIGQQSGAGSQTGSGPYTKVITLADPESVVNFEVGNVLEWRATDGAASADATVGTLVAVDRSNATISAQHATLQFAGWTDGGYLNRQGDHNSSSGQFSAAGSIIGVQGWIPDTAPGGSDNFGGQNRSSDPTRLGGWRFDGTAQPAEEALADGLARLCREGGTPDKAFASFATWAAIEKALMGRVKVELSEVTVGQDGEGNPVKIGFRYIAVAHPKGEAQIFADPFCPGFHIFPMTFENWKLESMGPVPHIIKNPDGLEWLRVGTDDAFECRFRAFPQISNNAPGWSGSIKTNV